MSCGGRRTAQAAAAAAAEQIAGGGAGGGDLDPRGALGAVVRPGGPLPGVRMWLEKLVGVEALDGGIEQVVGDGDLVVLVAMLGEVRRVRLDPVQRLGAAVLLIKRLLRPSVTVIIELVRGVVLGHKVVDE